MLILEDGFVTLETATGPMRCFVFRPKPQKEDTPEKFPAVILYSEIFQMTGPVKRTACIIAGHGFVVLVPEVYHELLEAGRVLQYTPEDSALGNKCKKDKTLAGYDGDSKACFEFLTTYPHSNGSVGVAGMCLGGGLAFRAAATCPGIKAAVCWYPTDLHTSGLSSGDDSLARAQEVRGKLLFFFGTDDPHVPRAGRRVIDDALTAAALQYEWHEVKGAHAFLRDENSYGRECWVGLCCNFAALPSN